MDLETTISAIGVALLTVIGIVGLWTTVRSLIKYNRAERNLRSLLDNAPERDALAELILQNPNNENIQRGRELVIGLVNIMSKQDRREISRGLYQDSVTGRARYVAKLVTSGRSNYIRRIPTDERVTG